MYAVVDDLLKEKKSELMPYFDKLAVNFNLTGEELLVNLIHDYKISCIDDLLKLSSDIEHASGMINGFARAREIFARDDDDGFRHVSGFIISFKPLYRAGNL